MARYRRIIADSFVDGPRPFTDNRPCAIPSGNRDTDAGIIPGTALIIGADRPASRELRVHGGPTRTFARAGANESGVIYIADLDSLASRDMYDAWAFNAITGIMLDPRFALNVLVPTGVSVTKGMGLTTNAQGWFVPAGGGQRVILTADETYNNNTGVYQHVRCRPHTEN